MLDAFFRPKSVAVIGASSKPGKLGFDIMKNMVQYGFKGAVYPVNPKGHSILGKNVVNSVGDLPDDVDMAVLVLPAKMVPQYVRDLAPHGVKACVVISSGFKEVGGEGTLLEQELARAAKETGIRVLGPNCIGVMDTSVGLNASFAGSMPNKGHIGFFSQSGAMCLAILDWSLDNAIGFSKFVSLGNKVDLTETEMLEFLAQDDETRVIMGYLESVADGRRFMEVAREVTRVKPVVLVKSGITTAGARAASSHTGALAGADAAYEAAFKQCGILRVHSVRELFNLAQALARQPLPKGPALAVVTNSGGPGIIAADAAELSGLHMAGLRPETVDELRTILPPIASLYNPVDMTGAADEELYRRTLSVVAEDPNVDGVAVLMTPAAHLNSKKLAKEICEVKVDKPVFSVLMGRHSVEPGRIYCMEQGMPSYDFPEDAVQAMRGMLAYRQWRESKPSAVVKVDGDKDLVLDIVAKLRKQKRLHMSENEARKCFAAYGVPTVTSLEAATSEDAAEAAEKLGFPVVMKIDSPTISHKSDVGGVKVGLADRAAVIDAFHEMTARVRKVMPDAWVRGVLVQQMVKGGRETIVGLSRDSQFGHLIMFGLGGIYVEVLKDVSFRVVPITLSDAQEMVRGIRSFPLLRGVRGDPPADVSALAQTLIKLNALVTDVPELAEADINPLLVLPRGQGVMAVDARISLSQPKGE